MHIEKLLGVAVQKRRGIEKIFLFLTLVCLICYPFVGVNYDLSTYLPESAPTKQALDVMEREFGYPGIARIMLEGVSLPQVHQIKHQIEQVEGVDMVIAPDSLSDAFLAPSFADNDWVKKHYKDGNALLEVVFQKGDSDPATRNALNQIYAITKGQTAYFSGSAVSSQSREQSIQREITIAMAISLVIIFVILMLTTTSWFEPFLFIAVMLVAIVLNMGSNILFGTISFFTFSTSAILQLAVSMDYSIFLQHTFTRYKQTGMDREEAMVKALHEACKSVLASGATTIVGFIVLVFMEFTIGRDVGLVLTKGILCSLAAVLFFMPALILKFDDKIEQYQHRPLLPSFDRFAHWMYRLRRPVLVVCLLLAIPCYVGQGMNHFYYGDEALGAGPGTTYYEDTQKMNEVFGKSNMLLAIVPRTSNVQERELTKAIDALPFVNSAISLADTLPEGVPESFVPEDITSKLHSKDYARILISMATDEESNYAFDCSGQVTKLVHKYYPKDAYTIGMTPTTMDIRDILSKDYNKVSILSLIGVVVIVLLTFKSLLVPVFVIIPIEIAIYLNMTIPYLIGDSMVYIGYIIVSCLQLGATIDYAILTTNNYLFERQDHTSEQAAQRAISRSALSVLTSGSILTVVGYLLYFTSSIQAISQVGRLVGRGAILSMILVLSLLPALLCAFDKQIMKRQTIATKEENEPCNQAEHTPVPSQASC